MSARVDDGIRTLLFTDLNGLRGLPGDGVAETDEQREAYKQLVRVALAKHGG